MLVVIPVSSSDADLISDFTAVMRHFGPYPGHQALVVVRPSDEAHARKVWEAVEGLFDSVDFHVFSQDGPIGWPQGPNFYWGTTAHHLQFERGNTLPWLWMELDTTPLKAGWLDALETEYRLAKMPLLGMLETTHGVNAKGEKVDMGQHIVGVAVYPPNLADYSTLWAYAPQMPTAFDVLCQWEFVPKSHNSALMQHGFRTQSYRRNEDGAFQGEDKNKFPNGVRFDRPIRPDVVLFHGCDDGSLARLIMSEKDTQISDKTPNRDEPVSIDADILIPRRKRARAA